MRTAIRADENPALDLAVFAANELDLPILVYQAVSERYPYASDRHHTFIVEGAKDVQRAFTKRGIPYAFHLERDGHRSPYLKQLAERAALVVTEDMPTEPLRRWTEHLARDPGTPVVPVDTACVVPMQVVGKAYERAYAYRNATRKQYAQRIHDAHAPQDLEQAGCEISLFDLPFESLDLSSIKLSELVAECEIDHAIGPVPHTVGGSVAGYARWDRFKEEQLVEYAKTRNDPLLDGVSRLSPYLHYGMVSPMRVARETAELDHGGAEKYLD